MRAIALAWWVALALPVTQALAQSGEEDEAALEEAQRGVATVSAEAEEAAGEVELGGEESFDRTPVLPELSSAEDDTSLSAQPRVFARRIEVENLSLLDPEVVAQIAADYQGREVSSEELNELRNRLSVAYFDAGYVNSGVMLPDQDVDEGVIRFREVVGRIERVDLEGNRRLNDAWWLKRIGQATGEALQINELQSKLQVLEQQPLVRRIEASITPGMAPGEGVLDVRVTETSPWRLEIGADNHRSPSLGGEQLTLRVSHLSLTGRGDRIDLYGNYADGLGDGGIAYTLPIGHAGTALRGYFSGGSADIVEAPFKIVDIQSETKTQGLELTQGFRRTPNGSITAHLGVETRHSESTLLDRPFSFSLGEIEGEADTSVLRAGLTWTHRDQHQVIAAQFTARYGTDWFDAATNPVIPPGLNGPETDFLILQGQAQYVRKLPWLDSELHLRGVFQLASDPLLPVEKLPVGGAWSVRGYRENLLVRDNGISASAEWRLPLFTDREPSGRLDLRALTAVAFADFGQSWDQDTGLPSDDKTRIYSVGLGVLWAPLPRLTVQLFRGEALEDLGGSGDDLQDRGWHWRVAYQVF